jgi:hypothetical protein
LSGFAELDAKAVEVGVGKPFPAYRIKNEDKFVAFHERQKVHSMRYHILAPFIVGLAHPRGFRLICKHDCVAWAKELVQDQ